MNRVYLAISYAKRHHFDKELECLSDLFKKNDIELNVFVKNYHFRPDEEIEMMQTAFHEIDRSDMLIAELTTKSIGVGIEIGYAYAKNKTILYLRKQNADYSTTASGCSNHIVVYKNEKDLTESVKKYLENRSNI